jgi:hypothetical protein
MMTRLSSTTIRFAVDVKRVEKGVAPGEDDRERGMAGGQGHGATDEEATPDQRADPLHHHPELINMWSDTCTCHGRMVLQGSQDLKWLPPKSDARPVVSTNRPTGSSNASWLARNTVSTRRSDVAPAFRSVPIAGSATAMPENMNGGANRGARTAQTSSSWPLLVPSWSGATVLFVKGSLGC